LTEESQAKEDVQKLVRMDEESFGKALEKLWIHGGAVVDFADNVMRGLPNWKGPYETQIAQKLEQLNSMLRYADNSECRMCSLVAHFGDRAGSMKPCGICDFCAPGECEAQLFREASSRELAVAREVLKALSRNDGRSTGKLFTELCGGSPLDRDAFEQVLSAMARVGLVELKEETFTADGREIAFRKVLLIKADGEFALLIKERPEKSLKSRKKAASKKAAKKASTADLPTVEALKKWRLAVAKKEGVPAFRVLTDAALREIAEERPASEDALLQIAGIGPRLASRYGAGILRVLQGV